MGKEPDTKELLVADRGRAVDIALDRERGTKGLLEVDRDRAVDMELELALDTKGLLEVDTTEGPGTTETEESERVSLAEEC